MFNLVFGSSECRDRPNMYRLVIMPQLLPLGILLPDMFSPSDSNLFSPVRHLKGHETKLESLACQLEGKIKDGLVFAASQSVGTAPFLVGLT